MKSWSLAAAILSCMVIAFPAAATEAAGKGKACGGASSIRCDKGLWCEPQPGRCGDRRARGRCVQKPEFCTMIYQPVCGCDGKTYSNDCVRRSSRVAKKHDGEC